MIWFIFSLYFSLSGFCQENNSGTGVDRKLVVTKLTSDQLEILKKYIDGGQGNDTDEWIKNNIKDPKMQWVLRYIHNVNRDNYGVALPDFANTVDKLKKNPRSIEELQAQTEFALTFISFRNEKHNKLAGLPLKDIFEKNRKNNYFKIALAFHPEPVGKVLNDLKDQGFELDEFETGVVNEVQTFRQALSDLGKSKNPKLKTMIKPEAKSSVSNLNLSTDGKYLYSIIDSKFFEVRGPDDHSVVYTIHKHMYGLNSVIECRVTNNIASFITRENNNYKIQRYKLNLGGYAQEYGISFPNEIQDIAVSPDGNSLFASSPSAACINFWDLKTTPPTLKNFPTNTGDQSRPSRLELSANGKILVSANTDKSVSIWNFDGTAAHGSITNVFLPQQPFSLAISPDGTTLYVGCLNGEIFIYELAPKINLKPKDVLFPGGGSAFTLAISPDGKTLYSGIGNGTIAIYSLSDTPKFVTSLSEHKDSIRDLVISPDGKTLYSGDGMGKTIGVWDISGTDFGADKLYEIYSREIRITPIQNNESERKLGECKTSSVGAGGTGLDLGGFAKVVDKLITDGPMQPIRLENKSPL